MKMTTIALSLSSAIYASNGMKMTIYDKDGQKVLSENVQDVRNLIVNKSSTTALLKPKNNDASMQLRPLGNTLFLDIIGKADQNFQVQIIDAQGKEIFAYQGKLNSSGLESLLTIPMTPGAFFVQALIGNKDLTQSLNISK